MDINAFYRGVAFDAYEYYGAHISPEGTVFRTYAPHASKVAVVGDFCGWKDMPMTPVGDGRSFELLIPEAEEGMRYKYRVYDRNGHFIDHCDPYGFGMELRPGTCSVVRDISGYTFSDSEWLEQRTDCRDNRIPACEVADRCTKRKLLDDALRRRAGVGTYNAVEVACLFFCKYSIL